MGFGPITFFSDDELLEEVDEVEFTQHELGVLATGVRDTRPLQISLCGFKHWCVDVASFGSVSQVDCQERKKKEKKR